MRGVSGKNSTLERALAALVHALRASGAPFMAIGGIAVIAHGVKRLTTDIDAVVQGDAVDPASLLRVLARTKIVPRIPAAEAFARENLVLLMRHTPTGVDLDVSFGWTQFEREALAARRNVRFGGVTAPMARPEDLVIFKALAARPKDIEDATALIAMHEIDLDRVRRRVEELADLAEEPRLINEVEAIISRAHTARSARSGATTGKARKRKKSSDKDDAVKMRGKKATPRPRL